MILYQRFLFALAIALPMLHVDTDAHFILGEPASWTEQNQLGDPQKVGPCGGAVSSLLGYFSREVL